MGSPFRRVRSFVLNRLAGRKWARPRGHMAPGPRGHRTIALEPDLGTVQRVSDPKIRVAPPIFFPAGRLSVYVARATWAWRPFRRIPALLRVTWPRGLRHTWPRGHVVSWSRGHVVPVVTWPRDPRRSRAEKRAEARDQQRQGQSPSRQRLERPPRSARSRRLRGDSNELRDPREMPATPWTRAAHPRPRPHTKRGEQAGRDHRSGPSEDRCRGARGTKPKAEGRSPTHQAGRTQPAQQGRPRPERGPKTGRQGSQNRRPPKARPGVPIPRAKLETKERETTPSRTSQANRRARPAPTGKRPGDERRDDRPSVATPRTKTGEHQNSQPQSGTCRAPKGHWR